MSKERTTAEIYSLSKARRRSPSPRLPLPESLIIVAETFGFDLPPTFTSFSLRRRKGGTEVSVKGGPLTLNLSYYLKTYPANFAEARKWIFAIADRHGWHVHETKDRRP